jgi:DNA-binding CsgD family transcriptional regulator
MVREQQVFDLVGQIYDAALDVTRWPSVLQNLVRLTHSNTGNIAEFNLVTGATRPIAAVDMPLKGFTDYETYYWQQDIWTPKPGTFEIGVAYSSQRTIADDVLLRSEFYHDWMKPLRLFYGMGGIPLVEGKKMLLIGVHRPRARQRPYGTQDIGLLQQLFPHFRRALQIQHRIEQTVVEREALAETTDHISRGIFAFGADGLLLWANRTGHALCRRADGLTIQRGSLTTAVPAETQRLRQLIHAAVHAGNGAGLEEGDTMLASRPSGLRPYVVLVSPIRAGRRRLDERRPAALVFVADPEQKPELPVDRLIRLYGLTPAEAQLAQHLAGGLDLKAIAPTIGKTLHTLRSQLKQVFQKTGTKRQAELMRLLSILEGDAGPLH